jgi:hypothetical protein
MAGERLKILELRRSLRLCCYCLSLHNIRPLTRGICKVQSVELHSAIRLARTIYMSGTTQGCCGTTLMLAQSVALFPRASAAASPLPVRRLPETSPLDTLIDEVAAPAGACNCQITAMLHMQHRLQEHIRCVAGCRQRAPQPCTCWVDR